MGRIGSSKVRLAILGMLALAATMLTPAPIAALPTADSDCGSELITDPEGDSISDVVHVGYFTDCYVLEIGVTALNEFTDQQVQSLVVEFDLDFNIVTGCLGVDAAVFVGYDAALGQLVGELFWFFSCQEFYDGGEVDVERFGSTDIGVVIPHAQLDGYHIFDTRTVLQLVGDRRGDLAGDGWLTVLNLYTPSWPLDPQLTIAPNGMATISFAEPEISPEGPVLFYEVEYRVDGLVWLSLGYWDALLEDFFQFGTGAFAGTETDEAPSVQRQTSLQEPGITSLDFSGFPTDSWVEVRVRADNGYGNGEWSDVADAGTPLPTCYGEVGTIVGTEDDDTLIGTPGDDLIIGRGGNDKIYGMDGFDILCGLTGKDKLFGGNDDDILLGGTANDVLVGGRGFDWLFGEQGNDALKGGLQGDNLFGGGGQRDRLDGGGGAEDYCNDPHRPTRFNRCETISNARLG